MSGRFFCHRTSCELSKDSCIKRQRMNMKEARKKREIPFPNCLKCRQGSSIKAEDGKMVVKICFDDENLKWPEELFNRLSAEAKAKGYALWGLCLIRLAKDLCRRDRDFWKVLELEKRTAQREASNRKAGKKD